VLRLMLTDHAQRVVAEAADGQKAVELCCSLRPDAAFIDIDMPKLDGHQAAQMIREENPHIRIIMISSLATAGNVQRAMQAGAHGFVVKPFNALKVMQAIGGCAKNDR
jgi:two-component system chemotaxis response regulator CheY